MERASGERSARLRAWVDRAAAVAPSPCTVACPAGVNVKGYVGLIAAGRFDDALALVREANPFPAICGRVCPNPCEDACARADFGGAVAIRLLKRFVADLEPVDAPLPERVASGDGPRVAVVGGGPAGLTAAADLARAGCRVRVFEGSEEPGGMMRWAIPEFRLPRGVIARDIRRIEALGVEIVTGARLGRDGLDLDGLLGERGFSAVLLAMGAARGRVLGIEGEELDGVVDALAYLGAMASGGDVPQGRSVAVIGGGNTAIDAARSALRAGAERVTVLYRRSPKEMPADPREIEEADAEGVLFRHLAAPVRLVADEGGRLAEVICQQMELGEPDSSGRRRPVPIGGSEHAVRADLLITAISQTPDLRGATEGVTATRWGTIEAAGDGLHTSRPHVFAAGDVVSGPRTIVEAIGQGHRAARGILAELGIEPGPVDAAGPVVWPEELGLEQDLVSVERRTVAANSHVRFRPEDFAEVEADSGLDAEAAIAEAQRCLRCGPCHECRVCLPDCARLWVEAPAAEAETAPQIRTDRFRVLPEGLRPMSAAIDASLCHGCSACADACAYDAPEPSSGPAGRAPLGIEAERCRGCDVCGSVCPTDAIARATPAPRVADGELLLLTCRWCVPESSQPEGCTTVQCAGSVGPELIYDALSQGARGVLIVGCGEDGCHFVGGSAVARDNVGLVGRVLEASGVDPRRLRLELRPTPSAAELAALVEDYGRELDAMGGGPAAPLEPEPVADVPLRTLVERHGGMQCLDCGKCTAVCHVAEHDPGFSPRALVQAVLDEPRDALLAGRAIWQCSGCGRCTTRCPQNVDVPGLVRALREQAVTAGAQPQALHGGAFAFAAARAAAGGADRGTTPWTPASGRIELDPESEIAFFPGCLPVQGAVFDGAWEGIDPLAVATAALRLLNAAGVKPRLLSDVGCCGHDLYWTGQRGRFRQVAAANTARIAAAGVRTVITACPECTATFEQAYPEVGERPRFETLHLLGWLEREGKQLSYSTGNGKPRDLQVTYHDACRMVRHLDLVDAPRHLLAAVPGVELREMPGAGRQATCCGSPGWTSCSDAAKQTQAEHLDRAAATGAELMLTSCPKCLMHFSCARADLPADAGTIEVADALTFLADALAD